MKFQMEQNHPVECSRVESSDAWEDSSKHFTLALYIYRNNNKKKMKKKKSKNRSLDINHQEKEVQCVWPANDTSCELPSFGWKNFH